MNAIEIPDFTAQSVQDAIARDNAAWQQRATNAGLERDLVFLKQQPFNSYEPPETHDEVLGPVLLNVMHEGAPAVRQFNAGPAEEPS